MKTRGGVVLAATILGSAMVFVDGTITNVALPAIQASLGASVAQAQWVVAAYTLFLAALMLVGGALGDVLGRRRVFAVGTALFAAASIWCGLAPGISQLIVARAVQGMAGALLAPGSLSLIAAVFPEEERGRAIGSWSAWSGIATAGGPLLGGWLVDHLSWRWAFFVNVPLALVVLVLLAVGVPESRGRGRRLDLGGAALATVSLGGLAFGLIQSSWLAAGLGLGAGVAFALVERRARDPMVPFAIFRARPFAVANLLTLLLYFALGAAMFFLPFNLIQVQGTSATAAGAALLPFVVLLFVLSRPAGKLVDRVGPRLPLIVGPAIAAAGLALLALPGVGGGYMRTFFAPVAVLGVGMALTITPLSTTVMNAVDPDHAGVASGINNAVSRAAGLIAIAVSGQAMMAVFGRRFDARLAALDLPDAVRASLEAQRARLAEIEIPESIGAALRERIEAALHASFVEGFRVVALLAAAAALAGGAAALWLPRRRSSRK